MTGILQYLGMRRRIAITLPIVMTQAQHHLHAALTDDIILQGSWQLTRRYWGHLSGETLTLHGPRARRQVCLRTRGHLIHQGNATQITLDITLSNFSEANLWLAIVVLGVLSGFMPWPHTLLPLLTFGVMIYTVTQWHLHHYTQEICRLLRDLALGQPPGLNR